MWALDNASRNFSPQSRSPNDNGLSSSHLRRTINNADTRG